MALDSHGALTAAGSLRSTTTPEYLDAACLMRFGTPAWTNVVDLGPVQAGFRDEANDRFHDVVTDSQDHAVVVGNKSSAYGVCLDASDNIRVAGSVFANWTIEEGQWAIWKYYQYGTLQTGFPIYSGSSTPGFLRLREP